MREACFGTLVYSLSTDCCLVRGEVALLWNQSYFLLIACSSLPADPFKAGDALILASNA